jgi:cell division septation protein DedD
MTARTTPSWGTIACFTIAVAAFGVLRAGDPARATEPTPTVEVFWSMPDGGTPEHVTYPQTYSPAGAVTPGVCYQIDTYSTADAALFTADNTLTEGEDYADVNGPGTGVISWRFVCVPAVEVVAPAPVETPAPSPTETPAPTAAPVESTPAPVTVTPRTDAVVEQVAAKTAAPVLAATGFDFATPTGVAFLLLLGGLILWSTRFYGKKGDQ